MPAGSARDICADLEARGFAHGDAVRAVKACASEPSMTAALDWLLLHLRADSLPASFAPGDFGLSKTRFFVAQAMHDQKAVLTAVNLVCCLHKGRAFCTVCEGLKHTGPAYNH